MKSFPWQLLLDWYNEYGRHDFPWRQYDDRDTSGYRVWLAEILLQQTQADRVVPFYEKILSKYPTIEHLARADYDEFFPYYQWLGYYSRARNLLKTANIVSIEYNWVFPRNKQQLKKLPGIGEYTARAILAFGHGDPLLAWDTNLETIFSRYYRWAKNIKLSEEEKNEIERDFQDFIDKNQISDPDEMSQKQEIQGRKIFSKGAYWWVSDWEINFSDKEIRSFSGISRDINNALMDWARTMEPKNANLLNQDIYIFRESEFYRTNGVVEIIEKKASVSFPTPDAQVVVILHQDHRVYYSLSDRSYSPFILPASEDRDTRRYVQDYFRQHYTLELSVRPVHKKWLSIDGKPYIAVNAQVQAGKSDIFEQYSKTDMKLSIEQLYSL